MFGKFKEKLKEWASKITKKEEEKAPEEEIDVETKLEKSRKKEKTEKKVRKKEKGKKEETISKEQEIEMPLKFEPGTQKYEPDLEKLEERIEEIEKEEKQGFFSRLKSKITKVKISEKDFEEYEDELKMLMLENNVAYEVVDIIIFKLKQKIVGKEILKKELESEIKDSLRDTIESILIEPFDLVDKITDKKEKPYVMLFCGVNGTGKTTTIAKIAYMLQKKHLSCIFAAGDTFRAASIEQIKKHGEKLGIKVIAHDYGSDPASVGFDAIGYAKKSKIDAVLIDTAGRMHTEKNLLKEIEKISRVCKPDTKIFVGEATTGNDSIEQIRAFDSAIGIDGIILTKADTDEKGGTSLSVGQVTRKPILYLGIGQEYDKLELFNKKKFTEKLGL